MLDAAAELVVDVRLGEREESEECEWLMFDRQSISRKSQ